MKKKIDYNIPRSEEIRLRKAKIILSREDAIKEITGELFLVKSQTGMGSYRVAQENELLCKNIAYNLTVLIHEMIELDGISDFLSFNGLKKEVTIKDSNGFGNSGGKVNGI